MNKFMLIVFLLVASLSFGQTKNIDEIDGNNWMVTPASTKYGFIAGWMNANRAALDALYDKANAQNAAAGYSGKDLESRNDVVMDNFYDFFLYSQTVNDIVTMLDEYYRGTENRHYYVWSSIRYLCGKELR